MSDATDITDSAYAATGVNLDAADAAKRGMSAVLG
jgi:hypothetical protein